jgi:multidrug efflux system membrane fusion protein
VTQIQPIAVTFTVPQDALPGVQDALHAGVPAVVAYASDDKTVLDRGTLLTIDNSIDAGTGTIKLKATFPNQAAHLWPGQFVNARLLLSTSKDALTVPSSAVLHGQDRLYVYVLKADQTVTVSTVQIARDDGNVAIVASGLEDGQQVITDGQSRLLEGSRVTVVTPATKQAGG